MKNVVVATDFSGRSDRAVHRASLLARQFEASLFLVHVVDDDMPAQFVAPAIRTAETMLAEISDDLREKHKIACDAKVACGPAFQGILDTAAEISAELIVVGPHRRDILREIFIGTTVERTIRSSTRPVLMVNSDGRTAYRRVLIATDFSDCSERAATTVRELGLLEGSLVSVMHGYVDPGRSLLIGSTFSDEQIRRRVEEEKAHFTDQLRRVAERTGLRPVALHLNDIESSAAATIQRTARRDHADLIVVGTHSRSGLEKVLLGSVTEQVLSTSDRDVLVIPARAA